MVLFCVTTFKGRYKLQKPVGKQGVCSGMTALSKPTSICGTSHRWGEVQSYPTQKLPVAHQLHFGMGRMCKFCGGEMDLVMNQL